MGSSRRKGTPPSRAARDELILELTAAGIPQREIQEKVHCSRSTVQAVLRAARATTSPASPPLESPLDPEVGDEDLKRSARRELVAGAGRLSVLLGRLDTRLGELVEGTGPTQQLRDLAWVRGVLQDKYTQALAEALKVGPAVPPPPASADFTPGVVVDTPAPPGAPDDAPLD